MPDFTPVASLDKLPPGSGTTVIVGGKEIAIFNVAGTIFAMDDACKHHGMSLGCSILEGKIVRCRGHGWRYDVTSGEVIGVPGFGVTTYAAKVENGEIHVALA